MASQHTTEEVLEIAEDIARENGDLLEADILHRMRHKRWDLIDYDRRGHQYFGVEFEWRAEDVPYMYADDEEDEEDEG